MLHNFKKISYVLIAMLMAFTACTKEGQKGAPGTAGTANVIYSQWATLSDPFPSGNLYYGVIIDTKNLTQAVFNMGDVALYVKFGTTTPRVPFLTNDSNGNIAYISFALKVGQIVVWGTYNNLPALLFRYIIIPGGTGARRSGPAPDLNDYAAVCKYYNIPE